MVILTFIFIRSSFSIATASGLDSFSAVQLCQVLKKVANAGASVLFTIHQPSSEIFNSFDHLILLNAGRVMYQGSVGNVPTFFGNWCVRVVQNVSAYSRFVFCCESS